MPEKYKEFAVFLTVDRDTGRKNWLAVPLDVWNATEIESRPVPEDPPGVVVVNARDRIEAMKMAAGETYAPEWSEWKAQREAMVPQPPRTNGNWPESQD
jgi:hypothetical protein